MHTIYAYEQEFNFTPDGETLTTLVDTNYALSFGGDKNVHTYQPSALTWNLLSDKNLRDIIVWKTDAEGDPLKYRVNARKIDEGKYAITMTCGEEEAVCQTDSILALEGKNSFWNIISDTFPLATFKLWFT